MDPIDVSVVIPTYRREKQLLEAIDSALQQQDVALEVIVVDDSPEGSARDAVGTVLDPRVHYMVRAEPSGGRPAQVRNDGAQAAKGRYLHFLDDDDLLQPGALRALSQALDAAPRAGMAFGAIVPFGTDQAKLLHHQRYFADAQRIARRLQGWRRFSASLVFRPAILVNSACMARRTIFSAVGGFDAEIPVCEDADLWSRIAQASGFVFVDRPVVNYRTGQSSMMHNLAPQDEKLHASYRIMQSKYRQAQGLIQFVMMKFWARVVLR